MAAKRVLLLGVILVGAVMLGPGTEAMATGLSVFRPRRRGRAKRAKT